MLRRWRQSPEDPGEALTRIEPRALIAPPGFPDFMTRTRVQRPGPVVVEGRAWSGWAPISSVEVSTDGGSTWSPAAVEPAPEPYAWARWTWRWDATPGTYVLSARATDASGRTQPVDQPWNRGGFANTLVQRVPVVVPDLD